MTYPVPSTVVVILDVQVMKGKRTNNKTPTPTPYRVKIPPTSKKTYLENVFKNNRIRSRFLFSIE